MLTRIVLSCFVWVIVGRWIYEEAKIVAPTAVPAIDYVLEKVKIPTHNEWSKEGIQKAWAKISDKTASMF